jgi:hypothetical protein
MTRPSAALAPYDRVAVHIHQDDPPRLFALRRAHQAPYGRGGEVVGRVAGEDRHGSAAGEPVAQKGDRGRRQLAGVFRCPAATVGEVEHVLVQDLGGGGGQRDRHPVEPVDQVMGGRQPVGGDGPEDQGVDRGDGRSVAAGDGERVPGGGVPSDRAHAQRRRSGGVQADTAPRERQQDPAVLGHARTEQASALERRVQEGRMQAEAVRVDAFGQFHLGEDLVSAPPGRAQPSERGPVAVAVVRHPLVEIADRNGVGVRGRPRERLRGGPLAGQAAGGVPGPPSFAAPGMDADLQVAGDDPDLHAVLVRNGQRRLDDEFVQSAVTGLGRRVQGQLRQRRSRQDRRAGDRVVGEPAVVPERQAAGEHGAVGQRDGGAQQRVPGVLQPGGGEVSGRAPAVEPVAPVLEGVGGKVRAPERAGPERAAPVHLGAGDVRLPGGTQEPAQSAIVATQAAHDGRGCGDGLRDARDQHRMRTDLDERAEPGFAQGFDRVSEAHRPAQVAVPVAGVQFGGVQPPAFDRGEERHPRGPRGEPVQQARQLVLDRLDVRGVRGVVDGDPACPYAVGLRRRDQVVQGAGITRDDHRGRAVDGRYLQSPGQPCGGPVHRERDRHHATPAGQVARDRPAPQRHHARRVLQRQRTGHARRGDLTLRVPHHSVRPDTERLPQPCQRHVHRERRGLDHVHPLQPIRRGQVDMGFQRSHGLRQRVGEHR